MGGRGSVVVCAMRLGRQAQGVNRGERTSPRVDGVEVEAASLCVFDVLDGAGMGGPGEAVAWAYPHAASAGVAHVGDHGGTCLEACAGVGCRGRE